MHKYPFSLFHGAKENPEECHIEKVGTVVLTMDKSLGRQIYKISGDVSANNYIDFSGLNLEGSFLWIQFCILKSKIATFHIELLTNQGISLRITISTIYDQPRFLGRSLRLPLPLVRSWTNANIDLNQILKTYCPSAGSQSVPTLKAIKVKLFTNMNY